jgi:hypothetical protein
VAAEAIERGHRKFVERRPAIVVVAVRAEVPDDMIEYTLI